MAKLNTRKKSTASKQATLKALKQTAGRVVTDLVANKVALWQQQELNRILASPNNRKNTYIIETKQGYRVGCITVTEDKDNVWLIRNASNMEDGQLFSKSRALLYAILLHSRKNALAKEVKDADRMIVKYTEDINFYRHTIKSANKNGEYERAEAVWYRLDDAVFKLRYAKERLDKTVNSAKYIKLWEDIQP
jgi:hypothetical protein